MNEQKSQACPPSELPHPIQSLPIVHRHYGYPLSLSLLLRLKDFGFRFPNLSSFLSGKLPSSFGPSSFGLMVFVPTFQFLSFLHPFLPFKLAPLPVFSAPVRGKLLPAQLPRFAAMADASNKRIALIVTPSSALPMAPGRDSRRSH